MAYVSLNENKKVRKFSPLILLSLILSAVCIIIYSDMEKHVFLDSKYFNGLYIRQKDDNFVVKLKSNQMGMQLLTFSLFPLA